MHDQFHLWNTHKRQIHINGKYNHFREGSIHWACFGKNIGTETIGKGHVFTRPVLILKKVYGHSAITLPLSTKEKQGDYYYCGYMINKQLFSINLTQIRYLDGKRILKKISSIRNEEFEHIKKSLFTLLQ